MPRRFVGFVVVLALAALGCAGVAPPAAALGTAPAAVAATRTAGPSAGSAASVHEPADEVVGFGDAATFGSLRNRPLNRPVVGMAATPTLGGYWLVASDGGIFPFGEAGGYGSTGGIRLNQPIVGMAATPTGRGYWLVASDGGIFPFGDAGGYGSTGGIRLNQPIVGMAASRTGQGYWLVASDGGIFPFGDAAGFGSTGGMRLNQPVVGMAATRTGLGYWLVASDGGIFPFGDAIGLGSTGDRQLNQPITSMARTPSGLGYWLLAADGGVFPFGDAAGVGSGPQVPVTGRVIAMAPTPSGRGYVMAAARRPFALRGAPRAWISVERSGGRVVAEQSSADRRRPASLSKLVTALAAVRRLPADARVPISARAAAVTPSEAGARAGEVWSLKDALHGLLLPSGNDMAYAIAERVSGSVEAFGSVMQAEAAAAGLSSASTWRDPAGLDGPEGVGGGNTSTAADLARLGRAALADPTLAAIVRTRTYTYDGPYGSPRSITNTNRLLGSDPTAVGVKTGFTSAAGQCLIVAATRNGRPVLTVVLGSTDRYAATEDLLAATPA